MDKMGGWIMPNKFESGDDVVVSKSNKKGKVLDVYISGKYLVEHADDFLEIYEEQQLQHPNEDEQE